MIDFKDRKKKIDKIANDFYAKLARFRKEKIDLFEKLDQEEDVKEIQKIKKKLEELTK
jgi:DNA replication initiation complex subunit (GINS family)